MAARWETRTTNKSACCHKTAETMTSMSRNKREKIEKETNGRVIARKNQMQDRKKDQHHDWERDQEYR
jgi:hypothetical protein